MKKIAFAAGMCALMSGAYAQQAAIEAGSSWETPKLYVTGKSAEPPSMSALMADQIKGSTFSSSVQIPTIRAEAIQETAAGVGARAGMARRLRDYSISLKKQSAYLDSNYDFSKLAISVPMDASKPATKPDPRSGNGEFAMILPAVLLDGHDADSFPTEDEMRIADHTYKVYAKSRLVPVDKKTGKPVVPTWREYLDFTFPEVQMPHSSLLPKNEAEKALWNQWVQDGWRRGEMQADAMFDQGMARLKRDFHGMLKGIQANGEGRFSRPKVAGINMGVTGGGQEMRVNDRVLRIVDHEALIADPAKWVPSPAKD